jgi:hypothetical protein
MVHTACLVCLSSTVSGGSKIMPKMPKCQKCQNAKNALEDVVAKLEQSIFFRYLCTRPKK